MHLSSRFLVVFFALAAFPLSGTNGLVAAPAKIDIPATPDGTIIAFYTAGADGHFEVLWQALPASYQADVKKMLRRYAQQIKIEEQKNALTNWKTMISAFGNLSKVLATKQDFWAAKTMKDWQPNNKITTAEVKAKLTIYSGLVDDIQKQMGTPEQLENLDVEQFLANLGTRAKELNQVSIKYRPDAFDLEEWKKVTAKVVRSTPDSAVVEVSDKGSTYATEMVKVEGKWIFKSIDDYWQPRTEENGRVTSQMGGLAEDASVAFFTRMVLLFAPELNKKYDELLSAKSQKEFDAVTVWEWYENLGKWSGIGLEYP